MPELHFSLRNYTIFYFEWKNKAKIEKNMLLENFVAVGILHHDFISFSFMFCNQLLCSNFKLFINTTIFNILKICLTRLVKQFCS